MTTFKEGDLVQRVCETGPNTDRWYGHVVRVVSIPGAQPVAVQPDAWYDIHGNRHDLTAHGVVNVHPGLLRKVLDQ